MKISIIVAVSKENVIGDKNKLLWHISDDLKRFKKITTGHHILMGQKTFESIGKVLPGRTSLILSFDKNFKVPGAHVFNDITTALKFAKERGEKELMVIGGGMVYKQLLPKTSKIYMTKVLKEYKGNIKFPDLNTKEWKIISEEEHLDEKVPFIFTTLRRK